MNAAKCNGIELAYETFGEPGGRPLLLIMGLAYSMNRWPDPLCRSLAERGQYVIRFDNRDVGLSTHLTEARAPNPVRLVERMLLGERPSVPYLLRDMAADTVGLLDALDLRAAHLVGMSMGGMIAQTMAIEYPDRVLSLVSIMSTTGRANLPQARGQVLAQMMKPIPTEREAAIRYIIDTDRLIAGDYFPAEEERLRDEAMRSYDRHYDPHGVNRQAAAIIASGSRARALRSVKTRALVIHGDRDPLVPIEGGQDTADCIPGARFLCVEGMGHYLARPVWPLLVDAISQHTAEAG
jgi:pimeloyl-ACP methyl ester carboxylesterase